MTPTELKCSLIIIASQIKPIIVKPIDNKYMVGFQEFNNLKQANNEACNLTLAKLLTQTIDKLGYDWGYDGTKIEIYIKKKEDKDG